MYLKSKSLANWAFRRWKAGSCVAAWALRASCSCGGTPAEGARELCSKLMPKELTSRWTNCNNSGVILVPTTTQWTSETEINRLDDKKVVFHSGRLYANIQTGSSGDTVYLCSLTHYQIGPYSVKSFIDQQQTLQTDQMTMWCSLAIKARPKTF